LYNKIKSGKDFLKGEEMKKVYILLTKSNTFCSKIIYQFTKGKYTHASISLDANFEEMYSFARKYKYTMLPAGFVKENLYRGVMGDSDDMNCAVYELEVTNLTYLKLRALINNMEKNKDQYRYNIRGLLGCIFDKKLGREKHFYCSEFVYYALVKSGAIKSGRGHARQIVKPMDLRELPDTREIFKGDIGMLRSKSIAI